MTDTTVLHDAALILAATLEAAANEAGWYPTVQVATLEPSFDCDSIYVWPDPITPARENPCNQTLRVTFQYGIGMCGMADRDETVIFTQAETRLGYLWAIVVAVAEACCSSIIGAQADSIELGAVSVIQSGDVPVWRGSVSAVLAPQA
jgi:hypothetical protein